MDFATGVVDDLGLWGIFILMMPESALIPIPSEATMLFAGFYVYNGTYTMLGGRLVGSSRERRRLLDRLRHRLLRPPRPDREARQEAAHQPQAPQWTDAGSRSTATPRSSWRACCRSSARSSRCRPASAKMTFWTLHALHRPRLHPVDVRADVHRQDRPATTGRTGRSTCTGSTTRVAAIIVIGGAYLGIRWLRDRKSGGEGEPGAEPDATPDPADA